MYYLIAMQHSIGQDDPNWVSPLADPWFERPPSLWEPEDGK